MEKSQRHPDGLDDQRVWRRRVGTSECSTLTGMQTNHFDDSGSGFGADGEGYVRFALVENEQRIAQAVRGIRTALT